MSAINQYKLNQLVWKHIESVLEKKAADTFVQMP